MMAEEPLRRSETSGSSGDWSRHSRARLRRSETGGSLGDPWSRGRADLNPSARGASTASRSATRATPASGTGTTLSIEGGGTDDAA